MALTDDLLLNVVTKNGTVSEICQSKAIERYIASQTGLFGANAEQGAQIDSIGELIVDLKTKFNAAKGDEAKEATYFNETLPQGLAFLEKFIAAAASGFVVGGSLSLGDVQLYHFFTHYFDATFKPRAQAAISAGVAGVVALVGANAGIAQWEADRPSRNEVF